MGSPKDGVDADDVGDGHEEQDEEEEEGGAVHPRHQQHHPAPPVRIEIGKEKIKTIF